MVAIQQVLASDKRFDQILVKSLMAAEKGVAGRGN